VGVTRGATTAKRRRATKRTARNAEMMKRTTRKVTGGCSSVLGSFYK
jgi:hypothetical protein